MMTPDCNLDTRIKCAFGERLRAARDECGLSRRELGVILSVSPKTIQSWENGRTFIERLSLVSAINKTLKTDVFQLVGEAIQECERPSRIAKRKTKVAAKA